MDSTPFDVDLSALLRVFGGHLYSTPAVFARELVQNGLDAITLRKAAGDSFDARVTVTVEGTTLRFEDNGIGLDQDGLREHLGRVGGSSKRGGGSGSLIGQFGIGLLSGFLVADELVVETRRAGCAALRWEAQSSGTYAITDGSREQVGTEVILQLREDALRFRDAGVVRELLERYVAYVDADVGLSSDGPRERISGPPPWERDPSELEQLAAHQLGKPPLDTLRVEHDGDVALLWVRDVASRAAGPPSAQCAAYQHGVLVSESVGALLPKWATFVTGLVETKSLHPTASREGFVQDGHWHALAATLEDALLTWLRGLPERQPSVFERVLEAHRSPLTAACVHEPALLDQFGPHLTFETNFGVLPLEQIAARGAIQYTARQTTFARIGPLAAHRDQLVVNACHVHEVAFLAAWARREPGRVATELSVPDLTRFVLDADEHRARFARLLPAAQAMLSGYHVKVSLSRFGSGDVPALFVGEADQIRERAAQVMSGGNALSRALVRGLAASAEPPAKLLLNVDNGLVSSLPELLTPEMGARVVRILYLQAAALARRVPSMVESQRMSEDLLELLRLLPKRAADEPSGPNPGGVLH